MWTIERQHNFHNNEHGPEIQSRMQTDLRALQGLSLQLPEMIGGRIIVEKGYAVDAACNGRLTRIHYDSDITLATPYVDEPEVLFVLVKEALDRSTGIQWVATPQKRPSWVKFHEIGKRQWDDGVTDTIKDQELAQHMDLHLVRSADPFASDDMIELNPKQGVVYQKMIRTAEIRDTFGEKYELTIPTVSDMLAAKLRLIRSFDTFYGHTLRASDLYDFELLFSHPDFYYDEFVAILEDYYMSQNLSKDVAHATIRAALDNILQLLPDGLIKE